MIWGENPLFSETSIYIYTSFQPLCTSSSISGPTHINPKRKRYGFFFDGALIGRKILPKVKAIQGFVTVNFGGRTERHFIFPSKNQGSLKVWVPGWWFQIFFIFTPIWGRFSFWLIFFKGAETTNYCTPCQIFNFCCKKSAFRNHWQFRPSSSWFYLATWNAAAKIACASVKWRKTCGRVPQLTGDLVGATRCLFPAKKSSRSIQRLPKYIWKLPKKQTKNGFWDDPSV